MEATRKPARIAGPSLGKSEQIRVTAWTPPLGDRELKTHSWQARRFLQRNFSPTPLAEFFRHPLPLIGHEEGKSTARFARDFSEVCKIDQSLKPLIGIVFFLKLRTLLCEKP
jgi:hypothetical protein